MKEEAERDREGKEQILARVLLLHVRTSYLFQSIIISRFLHLSKTLNRILVCIFFSLHMCLVIWITEEHRLSYVFLTSPACCGC